MNGKYSILVDGERFDVEVRNLPVDSPGERRFQVLVGDREHVVSVPQDDVSPVEKRPELFQVAGPKMRRIESSPPPQVAKGKKTATEGLAVGAPMTGKIVSIQVTEGQEVQEGDLLMVLEAMKMENSILALGGGVVRGIAIKVGDSVRKGDQLCVLA